MHDNFYLLPGIAISFCNLVSNIHKKYKIDKLAPLKQNKQKGFA